MDRFAESHVVGEAGPQSQADDESQPGVTRPLIRAKLRPQVGRGQLLSEIRRTQGRENRIQFRAGAQARPFPDRSLGFVLLSLAEVRSGQEPHPLEEGNPVAVDARFDTLPMREGFLEFLPIDLDPFPFQRDQAPAGFEQLGDLVRAERFPVEAHADGKLQQPPDAEAPRIHRIDLHADAGPGRLLRVPPVGHPDDQTARLEEGNRFEEIVRLTGRPSEGVVKLFGLDESPDQFRGFGRFRDRQQQREHRLPVLLPGVLSECPTQGFVPYLALRRQAVGERGQERERVVRIALVLGQVERHAADESPPGVAGTQVAPSSAGVLPDFAPGENIEIAPAIREDIRSQVLQPGHRGCPENRPVKLGHRGREFGDRFARFRGGDSAEFREIESADRAGEFEGRRQRRIHLVARGVEHPAGRAIAVGFDHRLRERPTRRCERRFANEEVPPRCDRQLVHRSAAPVVSG